MIGLIITGFSIKWALDWYKSTDRPKKCPMGKNVFKWSIFVLGWIIGISNIIAFIEWGINYDIAMRLNKAYISNIQETETAYQETLFAFEPTRMAYTATRIASPKNDFYSIKHNFIPIINLNIFSKDRQSILARMDTAIDCDQIFYDIPRSNINDPPEKRINDLINHYTQFEGIEIYELNLYGLTSTDANNDLFTYKIVFLDQNDNENDDEGLVLIHNKNFKSGFYYFDQDCWLY